MGKSGRKQLFYFQSLILEQHLRQMRHFRDKFFHHWHLLISLGFWEAPYQWITKQTLKSNPKLGERRAMSQQLQTFPLLLQSQGFTMCCTHYFLHETYGVILSLWGWEKRERLKHDPPSPSLASRSWSEPPSCVPPAGRGWGWLVVGSPSPSFLSFCLLPSLSVFWEALGAWEASGVWMVWVVWGFSQFWESFF